MPFALPGQVILTRGGRRVVAGVIATGPTEAEFNAHVVATTLLAAWSGGWAPGGNVYRTIAAPQTGIMWGSTHLDRASRTSTTARAVLHGMPDEATMNMVANRGGMVMYTPTSFLSVDTFNSVNRNGYLSNSSFEADIGPYMSRLVWWDPALGKARQRIPYTNSAVTDYTW